MRGGTREGGRGQGQGGGRAYLCRGLCLIYGLLVSTYLRGKQGGGGYHIITAVDPSDAPVIDIWRKGTQDTKKSCFDRARRGWALRKIDMPGQPTHHRAKVPTYSAGGEGVLLSRQRKFTLASVVVIPVLQMKYVQ